MDTTDITEVAQFNSVKEANKYLDTNDWVFLAAIPGGPNGVIYVLGSLVDSAAETHDD